MLLVYSPDIIIPKEKAYLAPPVHLPFYPRTKQCSVSQVKVFLKRKRKGTEKLLEHEESWEEPGIGNEDMLEMLAIFTIVISRPCSKYML